MIAAPGLTAAAATACGVAVSPLAVDACAGTLRLIVAVRAARAIVALRTRVLVIGFSSGLGRLHRRAPMTFRESARDLLQKLYNRGTGP